MPCTNPTTVTTISTEADLQELAGRPGVHIHSDTSNRDFPALGAIMVEYCEDPKEGPSGHVD